VSLEDAVAAFSSGNLGMIVATTAVLGTLQKASAGSFDLRTAAFPSFDSSAAKPTHSGAGLVVLSDDAAKQKAAWEFVKFLTSPEGYTMITTEIGYLPLRADLATDPRYLAGYFETNPLLLPPLEQLSHVEPYRSFSGPKANQATVLLQDDAIDPIVLREANTADTLKAAASRIRDLTGTK
jgi:multiple sugar transport system substrate-binding protein